MKIKLLVDGKEIEAEVSDVDYKNLTKQSIVSAGNGMMLDKYENCCWIDTTYMYENSGRYSFAGSAQAQWNTFATLEQAKAFDRKLEALRIIWAWHALNDGFMPDWNNQEQEKYFIYYDHKNKDYKANYCYLCNSNFFLPYFSSGEKIEELIEVHRKELDILFDNE